MLEAIGLTKKFQDYTAVNHLNLKVEQGEVFCLLGQNGAGKTTTINLFLGFVEPTMGEAKIDGIKVSTANAETKKLLAYIPEIVMLYGHLTGLENLDFFSKLAGYRYNVLELKNFLVQAGLQQSAFGKRASQYSKGMRQKVAIAIAIAKNSKVILMDEPISGLDPKATDEFSNIVKKLAENGSCILMATHDIFNAIEIGTRIGIMNNGKLIHDLKATNTNPWDLKKLYISKG